MGLRRVGHTKGGLNSKLHAVCDGNGRLLILLLSEGQISDYKDVARMLHAFPKAKTLLADKGYGADWFRDAFTTQDSGLHSIAGKPQVSDLT